MIDRVDRNVQRLLHMLTGIKRLNKMMEGVSKETFLDDLRLQDASAFDISTIGEAASNVTDEFKALHPEIPWIQMRGLRNRSVHIFDYEQIDYDIIWIVATEELPALEPKIRSALATIPLPDDFILPEI
ncbi:MAG: DUF86 domain-containing protein [Kiritimatiellae bacterium]|nr:DUF86 domain-containing protein [Kiritimatiellia bacterium]